MGIQLTWFDCNTVIYTGHPYYITIDLPTVPVQQMPLNIKFWCKYHNTPMSLGARETVSVVKP